MSIGRVIRSGIGIPSVTEQESYIEKFKADRIVELGCHTRNESEHLMDLRKMLSMW